MPRSRPDREACLAHAKSLTHADKRVAAKAKKSPAKRRGSFREREALLLDHLALDFALDATQRRVAGDLLLQILLVADDAWDRLRLAHAERLDLVLRHALRHQVVANGVSAAFRQLLVVRLRTDRVG